MLKYVGLRFITPISINVVYVLNACCFTISFDSLFDADCASVSSPASMSNGSFIVAVSILSIEY